MVEETVEAETATAPARRSRKRRVLKWIGGGIAALLLLIVGAVVVLNTPVGERFLADRIAKTTLPNGLNIRIGRIEGNLYGKAVLHDVVLSDPTGPFATIPRAEVDWNPGAWLYNRLEIDSFAARRATMTRLPEFLPSEDDGPILPGFDISIDRLEIDRLTLGAGIVGDRAETVDLLAEVQVRDQRLKVDARGQLGSTDRFAALIDAAPDDDRFDLGLNYQAPQGGVISRMLGTDAGFDARIIGDGSWSRWDGAALIRRDGERFAAFELGNRAGRFSIVGQAEPAAALEGQLARLARGTISIKADATIEERRIDGRYAFSSPVFSGWAKGLVDLAGNRADNLRLSVRLRDADALADGVTLDGARVRATLDGDFADLGIRHQLTARRIAFGDTVIAGVTQSGLARYSDGAWTLPLDATVEGVQTGNELLDPRLVRGRVVGTVRLAGDRLTSDSLDLRFPDANAQLALQGDLGRGVYGVAGDVNARRLAFDGIGGVNGGARITANVRPGGWSLDAQVNANVSPVSNATLANLAGPSIRVRGGVAVGSATPLAFNRMTVAAQKVTATLNGRITDGGTTIAGSGRHVDYGPFTVDARLTDSGPEAELVFADPLPAAGLRDVRVALSPTQEGFRIETSGGSTLGPFDGLLGLYAPSGGPVRVDVERLTVSNTSVTGDVTLVDSGVEGQLALSGGGLDGTIALAPRGGGQGVDVSLAARRARFGGATPLTIARADIDAQGVISEGNTTFSGTARGAGLGYGSLFIGRFAAQGEVTNGVGTVDASLAGRRGGSFRLDLKAGIAPEQVTLAARGEFAGRDITMPRRAVLTRADDGGWNLRRTRVNFGSGAMVAGGQLGGGETNVQLALARMPLSLADVAVADLGLGGTISGTIDYAQSSGGLPTADVRVQVSQLTRSGLVLSSKPIDLALVGELTPTAFEARAVMRNEDIQRGRLQARITDLPAGGGLNDRLRAGRLSAQLRYRGAAESLWRLAAIDAFDVTGPLSIAANASGTLADPQVRGSLEGEGLRVRSSLSGTDIRSVSATGRFAGSRLRLTRFAGSTDNGGTITGSGIVDLAGLGEVVEGRFVEVRGPTLDLRAAASNARLLNANGIDATITGPLRIVSNGLGGTIAGRVRIDRASWALGRAAEDVDLPRIAVREINRSADIDQRVAPGRPWRYLIDARGSSRIDVDGLGLDSEWGADIILRGTTDDPRIGGSAEVVRGSYSFAGTRFELTRGVIEFDANLPIDPSLDIRAETEQNGIDVEVRVTGNAQQPEISFTSNPALPEEEILARLLFGGSITNLSATDALQLGAAVASLNGGGGVDPINQLRSAIGLDRLRIVGADPALGRGTAVALGKNFGRRVYVELITDGQGYSATEVEFRVTSWLSLLASISTIGRESIVAEISRDY